MVVVAGQPRSGTSCTAGVLHHLGVPMGERFLPAAPANPVGYFEELELEAYLRHQRKRKRPPAEEWFRQWAKRRGGAGLIGCKHPDLCKALPQMAAVWPRLLVLATVRPIRDTWASVLRAGWVPVAGHPLHLVKKRRIFRRYTRFHVVRDRDIKRLRLPALRLPYYATIDAPEVAVRRIIVFLKLAPSPAQIAAAIRHVKPELCHERPL